MTTRTLKPYEHPRLVRAYKYVAKTLSLHSSSVQSAVQAAMQGRPAPSWASLAVSVLAATGEAVTEIGVARRLLLSRVVATCAVCGQTVPASRSDITYHAGVAGPDGVRRTCPGRTFVDGSRTLAYCGVSRESRRITPPMGRPGKQTL